MMLLHCGVGDSWESSGLQGDLTNCKGNQSWIFTGRTVAEAEAPILWPPDMKNWLTGKDPGKDAGKDWRQEEKGMTEDEKVGWCESWLTQWTWLWASSGNWWWTGKTGVLQSMGLHRVSHNWIELKSWAFWRLCGANQAVGFLHH